MKPAIADLRGTPAPTEQIHYCGEGCSNRVGRNLTFVTILTL
jgi:hypothetical protein